MDNSTDNSGPENIRTTAVLLVLATVFVLLRFWARFTIAAKYGLDDWLLIAGLAALYIIGGIHYGMIAHGLGQHASTLSQPTLVGFFKLLLAFECIYVVAVVLIKLSLLAMYLRIFPSRGFVIGSWIIGGTVVAWGIAIVLVCIFQCNPIYVAWMPWEEGTCINLKASFIGNAVPNLATDVAILCMPVKDLWNLKINLLQRVSLICSFMLGGFVLVASAYRFSTIMQFDPTDTTWTLATACTWCVVETACSVIGVCLPTLRPLAKRVSSRFGSSQASRTPTGNRNPTELITIGGSNTNNGMTTRNAFQKLGGSSGAGEYPDKGGSEPSRTNHHLYPGGTAKAEYASSGDSMQMSSGGADVTIPAGNGLEHHSKGFV